MKHTGVLTYFSLFDFIELDTILVPIFYIYVCALVCVLHIYE